MEHPSKRRRIERRATGSLRALLYLDKKRQVLETRTVVPPAAPDVALSSSIDNFKRDVHPHPSSASVRGQALSVHNIQRRGAVKPPATNAADVAQPVYDAAANGLQAAGKPADAVTQPAQQAAPAGQNPIDNKVQGTNPPDVNQAQQAVGNVAQPVQQVAQPAVDQVQQTTGAATQPVEQAAQPVTDQVQATGNDVADTAQNQVVQPVKDGANDAVKPVVDKIPDLNPAAQDATDNGSKTPDAAPVPNPAQNTDQDPAARNPPAAVAAAAARNKALAEQQAKATQQDPDVPSLEGPAPAKAPSTSGNAIDIATSQDANSLSDLPQSSTVLSTPPPVSETPTSISQITQSTSTSPSTLPPQSPAPTPALLPGILPGSAQPTGLNSTLTSLPSSIVTSSSTLLPTSTTQTGSESFGLFGAFATPSTSDSATQTASSSLSGSLTISSAPTLSTLITSISSASASEVTSPSDSVASSPTGDVGFAGANPTSESPASTSSSASSGAGDGSGAPPTGTLVGGICGGVAGLVLIFAALLFLLRYRKRKADHRREISPPIPQSAGAGSAALGGGVMTQRSSIRSTAPIAATANLIGRLRPGSSQTVTTTSTAPSEKGFQKISGRKLPSVLQSGGDGYGEKSAAGPGPPSKPGPKSLAPGQSPFAGLAPALRPPSPQRSLSGSSFYRDSHGFYGGVIPIDSASDKKTVSSASPTSSSPTIPTSQSSVMPFAAAGHPPGRSSPGVPNIRPGPARQPVIQQGGILPIRTPSRPGTSQQRPTTSPIAEHPFPRDPLGRSHPSQDGSRQSRFRESTTPP